MNRYTRHTVEGVKVAIDADSNVGVIDDDGTWLLSLGKVTKRGSTWQALPYGEHIPCGGLSTRTAAVTYLLALTSWGRHINRSHIG